MKLFKKSICFILIVISLYLPLALAEGLEAIFLDVGSADCALFICDGEAMMIDTGANKANWDHIQDVMSDLDIDSVQYLVLTHPHADHIGNAVRVIENYDVEHVLLPPVEHDTQMFDATVVAIDENGIDKIYPQVGDTLNLGNAEITVYGPHPVAYKNINDWSIVLMIRYAERSILMTGDIEAEAEGDLLSFNDAYPLKADVLKVAHHGSDTSSTFAFIQAVSPIYAVVSCNSTEKREYPHVETAMTLIDCGVKDIYTTEKSGAIKFLISETGVFSFEVLRK